jgi:hypothetical protein
MLRNRFSSRKMKQHLENSSKFSKHAKLIDQRGHVIRFSRPFDRARGQPRSDEP